jgi:hypothetical protein
MALSGFAVEDAGLGICGKQISPGSWHAVGDGIFAAPFEQGEIGPDLFRHARMMGLEGLVSKHRDRAYHDGRCTH